MRYQLMGGSGLRVSELCLGTMTFGEEIEWGASKEESRRVFEAFVEAGGNFVDTANFYTGGTSEKYVGEFMGKEREKFVLATKYTLAMRRGDANGGGNHRKNFRQSLEASLKRLKTDYIDLYLLHMWDFTTPVEEVLRAFDDAVREGKILYAGISNAPAWIIAHANTVAGTHGWAPFVSLQAEYSLIERTADRDLLPMAKVFDLGVTAWSPLGSGLLTGKYSQKGKKGSGGQRRLDKVPFAALSERNLGIAEEVGAIAAKIGRSAAQVALSWVRQRGTIPILGARTVGQMKDNLSCVEFKLEDSQMARLEKVSAIEMGQPHEFLAMDRIHDIIFGGMKSQLEARNSRN